MESEIKSIDTAIIEVRTLNLQDNQKNLKNLSPKMISDKKEFNSNSKACQQKSRLVNKPPPNFVRLCDAPIIQNKVEIKDEFKIPKNSPQKQQQQQSQLITTNKQLNSNHSNKSLKPKSPKKANNGSDQNKEKNRPNSKTDDRKKQLNNNNQLKETKKINQNENKSQLKKSASTFASINSQQIVYEKYWDENLIQEGLKNKTLIQARLRINQRSYEDAFVTDPNGGSDIYISGLQDRNRALNNDVVAIKLKEKYSWKILDNYKPKLIEFVKNFELENKISKNESLNELLKTSNNSNKPQNEKQDLIDLTPLNFSNPELLKKLPNEWFQRTGIVVGIIEKKNNRWAAGHLKLFSDKNKEYALFSPNDSRIPRMKIKLSECPPDFYTNTQIYANTLFVAQIVDIPSNSKYAIGELKRSIGQEGNTEVETEAILIENGIDSSEFDQSVIDSLPSTPWCIPSEEYDYRKDLRDMCIFTIDPATARDLDDALHCVQLSDDVFEIGVHIADVSYFVTEDSPIDKCASERATSVYLVQKVIPMLPRLLCEQLCSLNPATDRLTFSVIWKLNSNGDILEEWFGRTVINSAVKLSYEHAQAIIENPDKDFNLSEFPPIRSEFNLNHIKTSVLNLHRIAKALRAKRFENGCLVLNQVKINYILNKETGLPYGYSVYEQKDSNRLVEEFMLLANIAVAHRIYKKFPHKAILRRHPTPNFKQLIDLGETIRSYGFNCDVSSSSSIQSFLQTIQQGNNVSSLTLTCLLTKTMQLAQYFCTGLNLTEDQFYHYGLAVPLYTHFTSPIRRYPDVLVHRLLAASLGYCEETNRRPDYLQSIAENCNDKKYSARVCSEKSSEMFFSLFINECGPFEEIGCVIQIKDHSFDVLIVNLGISKRIYCDKLEIVEESVNFVKSESKPEISFVWKSNNKHKNEVKQVLQLFSTVNVVLSKHESDPLKFNITLKHPNEPIQINSIKLNNQLSEKKDLVQQVETKSLYLQRIDTDPYMCD